MSADRFHRAQYLIYAAVEQPPSRRAAFLRDACQGDHELLAEAESLLAAYREDDPFLEQSVLAGLDGPAPGDSIGPYRIVREIGRGGMGVVYLAEDTRLGREVAVKALAPELLANEKQRERFRREATLAASLSHPGIATIHALEEHEGSLYIVSEYVRGDTLADILAGGRLAGRQVLDLGLQLAEALSAAHARGVVHRDLKPDNIIRNEAGCYKILDFGVAIAVDPEHVRTRLTEAGMLVGTPAYMSPEQLRGSTVDGRSDLFSLGIILYEALAGRHPFREATFAEMFAAILSEEPNSLSGLDKAGLGLEPLVRRCLRKNPTARHDSAKELTAELQSLRAGTGGWSRDHVDERQRQVSWWRVHQAGMMLFYALIVTALWQVKVWQPGLSTALPFFASIAAGITGGSLRAHLLFTRRFNPEEFPAERQRISPWLHGADWALSFMLLAGAGAVFADRQTVAGVLAGAAGTNLILSLAVEPATTRAAFRPRGLEGDRLGNP